MVGTPISLAEMVRIDAAAYEVLGASTQANAAAAFPAAPGSRPRVNGYDDVLVQAVITVGGRDAQAFSPLVSGVVAQVAELDAEAAEDAQPHLGVLGVLNLVQVMGLVVPEATIATCRTWLPGIQTANIDPERWHWERGLAALALGDFDTARFIAARPGTGPLGVDLRDDPQFNIQAWFALFVAAVVEHLPWAAIEPRWEQFLQFLPTFVALDQLAETDVAWVGRILRHQVQGAPLGEVADWIHEELYRLTGLGT